ncbi:MAG: radical SAM protein [Rhodospirillaceae bacterium]|nr:radical SAM protein [Rhodospirillaceae bacterium]
MPDDLSTAPLLDPRKFQNPDFTADGSERAIVGLTHLRTVWFNTGTLCNLTCLDCYIESSPSNDLLAYLSLAEAVFYLDEIETTGLQVEEIAFTGGEPFMNPDIMAMIEISLERGFEVLVLTNAMKPMQLKKPELLKLKKRYGDKLSLRISIDHYTQSGHEELRGKNSWQPMVDGLTWAAQNGLNVAAAGRARWGESEADARAAYGKLFEELEFEIDFDDPLALVLFPEMNEGLDIPEITVACWDILGVRPDAMMCATSRMIVKRKGADRPVVTPCTLLPYDTQFELGTGLTEAAKSVKLNHPHCARFCVLGGGSCSAVD